MNKSGISREEIFEKCREMVLETGSNAISMRALAKACGLAVGSIYNYFPSKGDLVAAVVQSVWMEIFAPLREMHESTSFLEGIEAIFLAVKEGEKQYPQFFAQHALRFETGEIGQGRVVMQVFLDRLEHCLLATLQKDERVDLSLFQGDFTTKDFVHYAFFLLLASLNAKEESCDKLLAMLRLCCYKR